MLMKILKKSCKNGKKSQKDFIVNDRCGIFLSSIRATHESYGLIYVIINEYFFENISPLKNNILTIEKNIHYLH